MTKPARQSAQALWESLRTAGQVSGEYPSQQAPSPWYINALLACSGWLATLFLLGFLGLGLSELLRDKTAALITGILLMGAAWLVLRVKAPSIFGSHVALAVSLAGQALMLWPMLEWLGKGSPGFWLMLTLLQAVLVWCMPEFLHRVYSAAVATISLAIFLWLQGLHPLPLLLLAASWLWLHEFDFPAQLQRTVPIAWGITFGLLLTQIVWSLGMIPWMAQTARGDGGNLLLFTLDDILLTLVIGFVVWRLLQRHHLQWTDRRFQLAMAAALMLGALSHEEPGLTIAMTLLILGFSAHNRVLMGLAVAALLYFMSSYYYFLGTTLLVKSGILALVGVLCLLLRWMILRWLRQEVADA